MLPLDVPMLGAGLSGFINPSEFISVRSDSPSPSVSICCEFLCIWRRKNPVLGMGAGSFAIAGSPSPRTMWIALFIPLSLSSRCRTAYSSELKVKWS